MMKQGWDPLNGRKVVLLVDDPTLNRIVNSWRAAAEPLGVEIVAVRHDLGKLH